MTLQDRRYIWGYTTPVAFEWDEGKRASNLDKHAIDFLRARHLFDRRPVYSYPSPRDDERRIVTIGLLDERLVAVLWIARRGARRIISARRARRGEKAKYQALYGK